MADATNHVDKARILVLAPPDAPELEVLKSLPPNCRLVGVGKTLEDLEKSEGLPWRLPLILAGAAFSRLCIREEFRNLATRECAACRSC